MKLAIIYWTGTGNTEEMAKVIASEVSDATLFTCDKFDSSMVNDFDAFAFGCPSMGAEELEDGEFLPMWDSVKESLKGKNIVLFGSYGWGDGEWMETWKSDCAGINVLGDYIHCGSLDTDGELKCKQLASLIK